MLQMLVAVAALSQLAGQAEDLNLRVRTVNLKGDPVPGVQVRIGDLETKSDPNGIAVFENDEPLESGRFRIQVNLTARERINPIYIGRIKNVRWQQADRFQSGFVIPLWEWGDVNSLGTAVVRNPDHVAVVLQYNRRAVGSTRVVAKSAGDAVAWIEEWAPDLPVVTSARLARSLYAELEPGETIPERFADAMEEVYREVERLNQAARVCRASPRKAAPLPAVDYLRPTIPPNPRPTPADEPPSLNPATPTAPDPPPPDPPPTDPPPTDPPPGEPPMVPPSQDDGFITREVTTYRPVWETEYRDQQTVVRREVQETVMQDRNFTVTEPVTTMRTETVDQGSYVDQVVPCQATTAQARNRLQWMPGTYAADPVTGTTTYYRGGLHWAPQPAVVPYQVRRVYVPNLVQRQVPQTTYVQRIVTRKEPVQVTRFVDEVVTEKIPVRVRKMIAETETIRVPRNASEASVLSGKAILDATSSQ